MNKLMFFVLACVTLAVFRAALGVMVVALLLALLFAFITKPRETLAFMALMILSSLVSARPIACLVVVGLISIVVVVAGAVGRRSGKGAANS